MAPPPTEAEGRALGAIEAQSANLAVEVAALRARAATPTLLIVMGTFIILVLSALGTLALRPIDIQFVNQQRQIDELKTRVSELERARLPRRLSTEAP